MQHIQIYSILFYQFIINIEAGEPKFVKAVKFSDAIIKGTFSCKNKFP